MYKISTVEYRGSLRTNATHVKSGNEIITDAPTDNKGKGQAFSPTDLVATSLASCMLTIMGIRADKMNLDISGTRAEIQKLMASNPRRVEEIIVDITIPARSFSAKDKTILEKAARTCPVALTLHPDTVQTIRFHWT